MALREVLFGEGHGLNYVVLCNTQPPEDSTTKPLPISSVFQDSMEELSPKGGDDSNSKNKKVANFVLMDCNHKLPTSGKTIAQKFHLDLKQRPTIFLSSATKIEPNKHNYTIKQIPNKHLKTGSMLTKVITQMFLPHTVKITNTKDLKTKCLNSNYCALLLKGGGTPPKFLKDAIANLLQTYGDDANTSADKAVTFASIDSSTLYTLGLEEHISEFQNDEHRFVVFKKVSGGLKKGDSRLITSMASLSDTSNSVISYNSMESLVTSVINGSSKTTMKKLSSLPQVKSRTKKLVESERVKRQRKLDSASQKSSSSKTSSSSSSASSTGENDGSKEGRKAERERRREEHKKTNPNYRERTPEEIAEIERKRRQRMHEQAEKWNIGSDDAPPEGEPVDGGDNYFEDGEDFDSEDGDGDDDGEGDDEDVMDLD